MDAARVLPTIRAALCGALGRRSAKLIHAKVCLQTQKARIAFLQQPLLHALFSRSTIAAEHPCLVS